MNESKPNKEIKNESEPKNPFTEIKKLQERTDTRLWAEQIDPPEENYDLYTKPRHYPNAGKNDLIAFAMDNNVGAVEFNIMKYVLRYKDKNGLEDLLKAKTYLDRLIDKNS